MFGWGIDRERQKAMDEIAFKEGEYWGYKDGFRKGYELGSEELKNLLANYESTSIQLLEKICESIEIKELDEYLVEVDRRTCESLKSNVVVRATPMAFKLSCDSMLVENFKEIVKKLSSHRKLSDMMMHSHRVTKEDLIGFIDKAFSDEEGKTARVTIVDMPDGTRQQSLLFWEI